LSIEGGAKRFEKHAKPLGWFGWFGWFSTLPTICAAMCGSPPCFAIGMMSAKYAKPI
jgi:hypothetical protein